MIWSGIGEVGNDCGPGGAGEGSTSSAGRAGGGLRGADPEGISGSVFAVNASGTRSLSGFCPTGSSIRARLAGSAAGLGAARAKAARAGNVVVEPGADIVLVDALAREVEDRKSVV